MFEKLERKRIKKKKTFFSRSSSNIGRLKRVTTRASVIEILMSSANEQTLSQSHVVICSISFFVFMSFMCGQQVIL